MKNLFYLSRSYYALALLLWVFVSPAFAQQGKLKWLNTVPEKSKSSATTKVETELVKLESEYESFSRQKNARSTFEPSNKLLQVVGDRVTIDVTASENPENLLNELKALGLENGAVYGKIVSGMLPISRVDKLKSIPNLHFARPAYKPKSNAGVVTSQGDKAQRSDVARSKFGVNGKGTKIGVLSDSYNSLTGARLGTITGDLPGPENPNGFTTPVQVLADIQNGTDEGRAMLEIIHDVAPGANLAFHTAAGGQANFALGILKLRMAGCDVIVDDIFYLAEPFFQDGIIAQAVDAVVQDGAAYFSAAGNDDRLSYESRFVPSGEVYVAGEAHNFANGDQLQQITVPQGSLIAITLQWDDPYFSFSPGGEGAQTDLDIYLVNRGVDTVLAASYFDNIDGDPYEILVFENTTTDTLFNLLIERFDGPNPKLIKYIVYPFEGPSPRIEEYATFSPTIVGHPNAEGAIAVGAARYTQTPPFGVNPPRVENFSSVGGVPILFNIQGQRIKPDIRKKPEITAPNGGNTTFFIPGLDFPDEDGFPNFFGTSASAPHAAAVAGLMQEAANKNLAPRQVRDILQRFAIDMDDPFTKGFDKGFDFKTGAGFIQADASVEEVVKGMRVVSFTLIDAESDKDLFTIQDGAEINLLLLPSRKLNIRANTQPAKVGSVVFRLNDRKAVENNAPYAFAANTGNDYFAINPPLTPGDYTLSAVPYSQSGGRGTRGTELTVKFRVVEQAAIQFMLVNAENNQDIQPIEDGSTLSLSSLPTRKLNIRAYVLPEVVGSVKFKFDNHTVIENHHPYLLGGDENGKYRVMKFPFSVGAHTLAATAYSMSRAQGEELATYIVAFTVVDDEVAKVGTEIAGARTNSIRVFPNPSLNRVTVEFEEASERDAVIQLIDYQGKVVHMHKAHISPASRETELDISTLPTGLYIVHVNHELSVERIKLMKQ